MSRQPPDYRTYEDFAELCQRYRAAGLTNLLAHAERGKDRCLKEKRFRRASDYLSPKKDTKI